MLKRVVMVVIAGVGLLSLSGSDARAHYAGYQVINGYLKHVSSFECGITIKQVPNPDTHPALIRCEATVTEAQLLCENPQNHDVRPGKAGMRVVLIGQAAIEAGDITDKKKGRARPNVLIDDDAPGSPLLDPRFCVNPNWHPVDVLSTKVEAKIETIECTDDSCSSGSVAYREVLKCALPSQYSISNPPPPGTDYACVVISKEHLD